MMDDTHLVLRALLVLVFGASGVGKLVGVDHFISTVRHIRIVPPRLAAPASVALIAAEFVVAFAAAADARKAAVGTAMALVVIFIIASILGMRLPSPPPCRCFGSTVERLGKHTLIRAITLAVAIAVYGATSVSSSSPHSALDTLLALTTTVGLLLVARWLFAAPWLFSLVQARHQVSLEQDMVTGRLG